MNTAAVISKIVANDLCIGCGACVTACPNSALTMTWNEEGFLVASMTGNYCDCQGECVEVCPFNPEPKDVVGDENVLADRYLSDALHIHTRIGRYTGLYVGYAEVYRSSSSSGGIATYILQTLLRRQIVDHVIAVTESTDMSRPYVYTVMSSADEVATASKTRYFPVTLADVLQEVEGLDGQVAVTGVGCFVKAIRLLQAQRPLYRDKISFIVGIICGGVKSKFFTEYLASTVGVHKDSIRSPEYRIKDGNSAAIDYSFGCTDGSTGAHRTIKMAQVGDMWGTGLFKANACDFCDDVTTELADISLGDAWIDPYRKDGRGTSIIITRSIRAEELIQAALAHGELVVTSLELNQLIASQQGGFNHRQDALYVRLRDSQRRGDVIPPKRHGLRKQPLEVAVVQRLRRRVRKKSLILWRQMRDAPRFDEHMRKWLVALKLVTKASHLLRRIRRLSWR